MRYLKLVSLGGLMLSAVLLSGCNWVKALKARDQLNKGVGAFRNAQFQAAIDHFQTAVTLDPRLLNARLYLATAYAQQYIPGGESPENLKLGQQAIDAFEDVLKIDTNNATALASIAQIYFNMKKFDKAKEYQRRRLEMEPNNPEPHYWIGVIDWTICFPRRMQLRKDLKLADPKDPNKPDVLPPLPAKAQSQLAKDNGDLVDEAIKELQKALELKPNDSDAMAYLNLMYREKADLEPDAASREADTKQAEEWVNKSLELKKQAASSTR
jgi:tetratricopeptide (TPR) repeat protein